MTQRQLRWHQPLSFLAIGGILFIASHSAVIQGTGVANAQLQPIADDTLGNERSVVTPFNPAIDMIDGGAQRGANLFHSFREFNIDVGRGVYFTNPAGVANILTRVTGGNPSQILGTLGVNGTANLFLINPNGILFGPNAQLALGGGSFLASTADSILFSNGFAFSTTNPRAPPLLTINVPVGLQYGSNPGAIQVQQAALQVPNGQTLTLAGGTVNVDGGQLLAPGGRVELGSVAAPGEVGLSQQGQEWRLSLPDGLGRADMEIGNNANVNVRAGGGGSIAITARNLTITGAETQVRAGIEAGFGTVGAQAGDIAINTAATVSIDTSTVANIVRSGGIGNAGDINITTGSLSLTNGTQVLGSTFGQGNAGNITIEARDAVSFSGVGRNGRPSGTFSEAAGTIGEGGNISITTGSLSLSKRALVSTSTFGKGNAGSISINARDTIVLDGKDSDGSVSVTSSVNSGAVGQGGRISFITGTLSFINGARVSTNTSGQGNAGNIIINARDMVSFDGVIRNRFSGGAFSIILPRAAGRSGDINITQALSTSLMAQG